MMQDTDLYNRAVERAHDVQRDLQQEAGGFLPTEEVADLLAVSRQAVEHLHTEGMLLAWDSPDGRVFPACQFIPEGRLVDGLPDVLRAMHPTTFWEALAGLVTKTPALEGRSVIEALADTNDHDRLRVIEIARAYAHPR
jgi:hypothetical protein